MKFQVLTKIFLITFILFFGCESCKKDNLSSDDETGVVFNNEGNLTIINHSNYKLALIRPSQNDSLITYVPNSSEDFIVKVNNIPTSPQGGKGIVDLRLRRVINGEIEAEDYLRWEIALSTDNKLENRVTWYVTPFAQDAYTGTIKFIYVGGTDFQVDILMNNRSGTKLTTLKPGDQFEKVFGLSYGIHTILYRYFYSSNSDPNPQVQEGWIEKEIVNGDEVDIYIVLNDAHSNRTIIVPHFDGGGIIGGTIQKGIIKTTNKLSAPLFIYAGSELIENVVSNSPQSQASSILEFGETREFEMPIGNWIFSARYADGTPVSGVTLDTTIVANQSIEWIIE